MSKFLKNKNLFLIFGTLLFSLFFQAAFVSAQRVKSESDNPEIPAFDFSIFGISKDALQGPSEPALTVDRSGYVAGDTVVISGQRFAKGEDVTISVEQSGDNLKANHLLANWTIAADENGEIVFDWHISYKGTFIVKAFGSKTQTEVETRIATLGSGTTEAGNPSCATLNADNADFPNVTSDWGFKLDGAPSGTFTFTNGPGRELTGGAPETPGASVTTTVTGRFFDWASNIGIDAVIVKGGPNAEVYVYDPEAFADSGLTTPGSDFGISHIEFCFDLDDAKIIIIKDARPNTTQAFNFTATGQVSQNFSLVDDGTNTQNSITFDNLNKFGAGNSVTITEAAPSNFYNLVAINCTSTGLNNNTTNTAGRFATIVLEPNEVVTCTFVNAVTTAAGAAVSGRVADESGMALPRTTVTILNTANGSSKSVVTNSFGRFKFDDLEVGDLYVITVRNKKYVFAPATQSFVLSENISELNFSAVSK